MQECAVSIGVEVVLARSLVGRLVESIADRRPRSPTSRASSRELTSCRSMTEITSRLSTALADRYKIERELGSGGMATVYLTEHLKHNARSR